MAEPLQASPTASPEAAGPPTQKPTAPKQRVVGLDIFRGLTMAVMLIVDYNGDVYKSIGHAPWNGVRLADFVMPFFLFISGLSMSISLKVPAGSTARRVVLRVWYRALKLFLIGLMVQGGVIGYSNDGAPVLSFDLSSFRIMGILQRIALALLIVSAIELLVPNVAASEESLLPGAGAGWGLGLYRTSGLKWFVALLFFALQLVLTYGVSPPDAWPGCADTLLRCDGGPSWACAPDASADLADMGCSGAGWLDTLILGVNHVYMKGTDGGAHGPPNFGFDPEGLTTSWGAVLTMYFGLHVGRIGRELKSVPHRVLIHWSLLGAMGVALGLLLSIGVPMNKRLWSPSYNFFMCGCATLVYALFFVLCDAGLIHARASKVSRAVLAPLQWLGSNCILFYVLSDCCGVLSWCIQIVTWGHPSSENNIVYFFDSTVLGEWFNLAANCHDGIDTCGPVLIGHTVIELLMWILICGFLYRKGIFWKV